MNRFTTILPERGLFPSELHGIRITTSKPLSEPFAVEIIQNVQSSKGTPITVAPRSGIEVSLSVLAATCRVGLIQLKDPPICATMACSKGREVLCEDLWKADTLWKPRRPFFKA